MVSAGWRHEGSVVEFRWNGRLRLRICMPAAPPGYQTRLLLPTLGGGDLTATSRDIMLTPVVGRRPSAMVISTRHRKSRPMHLNVMTVRRGPLGALELLPVGAPAQTSYEGDDDTDQVAEDRDLAGRDV
jgi:hypothetical protein